MRAFDEAVERRGCRRVRRDVACKLLVDGRCYPGTIRDVSASGLFVETRAVLAGEANVVVSFRTRAGERLILETSTPQRPAPPLSLGALAHRAVALRVQEPPATYRAWVDGRSAS